MCMQGLRSGLHVYARPSTVCPLTTCIFCRSPPEGPEPHPFPYTPYISHAVPASEIHVHVHTKVKGQTNVYLVRSIFSNNSHVNIGLLPDQVEVFVQAIKEKGQQLLGVMLRIAHKLRSKAVNLGLGKRRP